MSRASQNRAKIGKILKETLQNLCSTKGMVFDNVDFMKVIDFLFEKQWILRFRTFKNPCKNRCQNAVEKSIAKEPPKNHIWYPFGPPKTSQTATKIFEIPSRSDLEQSLLHDAMELASTPSESNGPRPL